MYSAINILAAHVASTLPDSISRRLEVLIALRNVLKASHPAYDSICNQINALDRINQLQAELPLNFNSPNHQNGKDGKS